MNIPNISHQIMDSESLSKYLQEPRLCLLLNPDLSEIDIQSLLQKGFCYVVDVPYRGKDHLAVVDGVYRKPLEKSHVEQAVKFLEPTYGVKKNHSSMSRIFDKLIEEPELCRLVNENVPDVVLRRLRRTLWFIEIEHERRMREGIVCAYFEDNPDEIIVPRAVDVHGNEYVSSGFGV